MRFTPKTDAELAPPSSVWPAGVYDFEVSAAEEAQSKAGNDMVKLTLHVFDTDGKRRTAFDYLVASEKALFKIAQFAKATGMGRQYDSGELYAEDMVGKAGRLKLVVQKDDTYGEQNRVGEYLAAADKPAARAGFGAPKRQAAPVDDLSDSIPF